MAQTINRLTATKVQNLRAPGMYADGAGLYLQVTGAAAKSWLLRYSSAGPGSRDGLGIGRQGHLGRGAAAAR